MIDVGLERSNLKLQAEFFSKYRLLATDGRSTHDILKIIKDHDKGESVAEDLYGICKEDSSLSDIISSNGSFHPAVPLLLNAGLEHGTLDVTLSKVEEYLDRSADMPMSRQELAIGGQFQLFYALSILSAWKQPIPNAILAFSKFSESLPTEVLKDVYDKITGEEPLSFSKAVYTHQDYFADFVGALLELGEITDTMPQQLSFSAELLGCYHDLTERERSLATLYHTFGILVNYASNGASPLKGKVHPLVYAFETINEHSDGSSKPEDREDFSTIFASVVSSDNSYKAFADALMERSLFDAAALENPSQDGSVFACRALELAQHYLRECKRQHNI